MFFSWPKTPVFLPKRPKNGLFLLSVRFLEGVGGPLGIDGKELTKVSETALFWEKIGFAKEAQRAGQTHQNCDAYSLRLWALASLR